MLVLTSSQVNELLDLARDHLNDLSLLTNELQALSPTSDSAIVQSILARLSAGLDGIKVLLHDYQTTLPRLAYTNEAVARVNHVDVRDPR